MAPASRQSLLLGLFALSGMAGLVYESVWTHYLKLFLGHAAYAQALVLCVFMGGLSMGAALIARYSARMTNVLRLYAVAELLIGLIAVVSHSVYQRATGLVFEQILPSVESVLLIQGVKWGLGIALLLPQSILLGATFPLMCAAFLRREPGTAGSQIAVLYFSNSLGGAVGVLISGFVLIALVGLPGTLLSGGIISIVVGLIAWMLSSDSAWRTDPAGLGSAASVSGPAGIDKFLLAIAMFTGLASFLYEIGWIRMLSLVLGATTHAFELMLSAFILGLALGGLWIRRRIELLRDPVMTLVRVQLLMGVFAVLTLPLYGYVFELMELTLSILDKTNRDYDNFLIVSHVIALIVMLPATICAGMTLPLIIHILLTRGHGERSVGLIYASNTVGAIIAVLLGVHVILPLTSLKSLIVTGGAVDVGIAVGLVLVYVSDKQRRAATQLAALGVVLLVTMSFASDLDPRRMASGVFRTGTGELPADVELLFQKDGKTATVSVLKSPSGVVTVLTNGKPDASLALGENTTRAIDESTQVLLAALPLILRPEIRSAAVIGLGSGMTTRVALQSENIEVVDTIEIEHAMVEAADFFRPLVDQVFEDQRSRIFVEDAKTFFSTRGQQYDLIISEPSNPWVSGVSSLFTQEFYRQARRYLSPDGLFVQWLHVYELDTALVMTVLKALSNEFPQFQIFQIGQYDIAIVATGAEEVPLLADEAMRRSGVRPSLERIGIYRLDDLENLYLGSARILKPLIASFQVPANSDFFPVLDLNAPRARFVGSQAGNLFELASARIPVVEMLTGRTGLREGYTPSADALGVRASAAYRASVINDVIVDGENSLAMKSLPARLGEAVDAYQAVQKDCSETNSSENWYLIARYLSLELISFLPSETLAAWWQNIRAHACYGSLDENQRQWISLLEYFGVRDAERAFRTATNLLKSTEGPSSPEEAIFLIKSAMVASLSGGHNARAASIWGQYDERFGELMGSDILLRLLVSISRATSTDP